MIAPDLPGVGDSGIPADGLDMKTAAIRIHELARSLGVQKLGEVLGQQTNLVASDVTVVLLKDTGHWVLEERPEETTKALQKFL